MSEHHQTEGCAQAGAVPVSPAGPVPPPCGGTQPHPPGPYAAPSQETPGPPNQAAYGSAAAMAGPAGPPPAAEFVPPAHAAASVAGQASGPAQSCGCGEETATDAGPPPATGPVYGAPFLGQPMPPPPYPPHYGYGVHPFMTPGPGQGPQMPQMPGYGPIPQQPPFPQFQTWPGHPQQPASNGNPGPGPDAGSAAPGNSSSCGCHGAGHMNGPALGPMAQGPGPAFDPFGFAALFSGKAPLGGPQPSCASDPREMEQRLGQAMEICNDLMQGKSDPSKIMNFVTSTGTYFWKGAIVGAVAAFLLTSGTVKSAIGDMMGSLFKGSAPPAA